MTAYEKAEAWSEIQMAAYDSLTSIHEQDYHLTKQYLTSALERLEKVNPDNEN